MSARRSIIIITYGRTGSTLLVGLLNTARRTQIRGENGNFFFYLFKSYQTLARARRRGGVIPNHPFYGINRADIAGYLALCRRSVYKVLAPRPRWLLGPTTIGFKEIRYLDMSESDLTNYIDFLEKIFPDPVFVFLTRAHQEVISSGFYQKMNNKEKVLEQLGDSDRIFSKICASKSNTFSIDYKDLSTDSDRLRELFARVGLNHNADLIESVMQVDHSPQTPDHLKKQRWSSDEEG